MNITRCLLALVDCWGIVIHPLHPRNCGCGSRCAITRPNQGHLVHSFRSGASTFRAIAPLEVSLFASKDNTVVQQFFSIHRSDVNVISLDAFHHPWPFQVMYAFPPPHLILQTLAKFASSSRCWSWSPHCGKMQHGWARHLLSLSGIQCSSQYRHWNSKTRRSFATCVLWHGCYARMHLHFGNSSIKCRVHGILDSCVICNNKWIRLEILVKKLVGNRSLSIPLGRFLEFSHVWKNGAPFLICPSGS